MQTHGKLCSPIRRMLDGDEYGSVVFHTRDYKHTNVTRISVLNLRKRYGYDYKTRQIGDDKLMVIRKNGENLPSIDIDIREDW